MKQGKHKSGKQEAITIANAEANHLQMLRRARQETVTTAEAEANMQNAKQEAMMEHPSN